MSLRFLAIDPGDVWVGVAYVALNRRCWHAETRVFCRREEHSLAQTVQEIFTLHAGSSLLQQRELDGTTVICESYQQRPVGYGAFNAGETLQLIGALRYVTEYELSPKQWHTVAPGNPDKELPELPIYPYLKRWSAHWPNPHLGHWQHARSAWRVMARYWLRSYPELLSALRTPTMCENMQVAELACPSPLRTAAHIYPTPNADWLTPTARHYL